MPVFHAFLTVDTQKFLESPERIHKLLSLSEKIISEEDCDENTKAHAAKMLEVALKNLCIHSRWNLRSFYCNATAMLANLSRI